MLDKKEKKELPFVTIGRLAQAIKDENTKRALELLEKVIDDMSKMDIELMHKI